MPKIAHVVAKPHHLAGLELERLVPVEQAVESEQGLGACGVQLREVDEGRAAQRPGDVAVLPAALGPALAVTVELDRADERDVADLAGQRDAVVGESEQRGELLEVVVLAGAHVAAQREVQRSARRIGARGPARGRRAGTACPRST